MKAHFVGAVVQVARVCFCAVILCCAALTAFHINGITYVNVASDSMAPTAARGDLLLLKHQEPSAGNFVLFEHRGIRVVHRLVEKTATGEWITRGDANNSDDPWRVDPEDIKGVAIGVIRGFGFPALLKQGVEAKFTSRATALATGTSTYWQQAAMSWTIVQNLNSISYKSPNMVTFAQSGNRKIWSTSTFPGAVHAHFYGRLSSTDLTQGGFTIITHACSVMSDSPSCGLALVVNTNLKQIQIRTVSNDIFGKVLASAAFSVSFTTNQHLGLYRFADRVEVWLNGVSIIRVDNLGELFQLNGSNVPSGGNCGVWVNGGNRLTDARINFW